MDKEKVMLNDCCYSAEILKSYLLTKARHHNCYKWYSTRERIESSLEEKALFLSLGNNWNDVEDRNAFNSETLNVVRFGKCFSFSKSESVAMWMLYGGMAKDGAMLNIKPSQMKKIVENNVVEFGFFDDGKFISVYAIESCKYQIELIDMIYICISDSSEEYTIKRSDSRVDGVEKSVVDELSYCKKSYPWNYENECRLVITVPKSELLPEITTARITIPDDICNQLKKSIFHSPNYNGEVVYNPSKLKSSIDWDLCSGMSCNGRQEKTL